MAEAATTPLSLPLNDFLGMTLNARPRFALRAQVALAEKQQIRGHHTELRMVPPKLVKTVRPLSGRPA
jgi:hypothetical protein